MHIKKIIVIAFFLVVLLVASIYFIVPSQISVGTFIVMPGSSSGISRTLQKNDTWNNLFLEPKIESDKKNQSLYVVNKDTFCISELLHNTLKIEINHNGNAINSTLSILPIPRDSVALNWIYTQTASLNPYKRLQQFSAAISIKKNMIQVLDKIKHYTSNNINIYRYPITETSITDTLLISTSKVLNHYPTTPDIYSFIHTLEFYAHTSHIDITGHPFLNITKTNQNQYNLMVALPVNEKIENAHDIQYKRMVPGRFLTTTVVGGNKSVDSAYHQMQLYFADYQRTAMAIPFQILVTNRISVSDSSLWVTKLYFPVM